MTAILTTLKDKTTNNTLYPTTKTNAITDSNGTDLDSILAGKQSTLTFDNTPTQNSTNPVTSGGIKNYVDNQDRDLVKILEVVATIGRGYATSVNMTASIPSGYKFLCWLQPATAGWIGSVYSEYQYNSTTNFYNASTNNVGGSIHCAYLVIKDI